MFSGAKTLTADVNGSDGSLKGEMEELAGVMGGAVTGMGVR